MPFIRQRDKFSFIDVFRILQPLMMQNLGGHRRLARPIRAGNHNKNWLVFTCRPAPPST